MLNEERYSVYREILSQEMNGTKIVLAIFGVLLVVVLVILFIQIKKFRDRMHAVENKKKSKKKKEKSQKQMRREFISGTVAESLFVCVLIVGIVSMSMSLSAFSYEIENHAFEVYSGEVTVEHESSLVGRGVTHTYYLSFYKEEEKISIAVPYRDLAAHDLDIGDKATCALVYSERTQTLLEWDVVSQ